MDQLIQWWHRKRGHKQHYVTFKEAVFGGHLEWLELRCNCGRVWRG